MAEYTFFANSNDDTKRIVKLIENFEPKIYFIISDVDDLIEITTIFESEVEKDEFCQKLGSSLNISKDGSYLKGIFNK